MPRNGRRDDSDAKTSPRHVVTDDAVVDIADSDSETPPNESRSFSDDDDNLLALLEQNRNRNLRNFRGRQKSGSEGIRRGQGRAVDIANILSEIMTTGREQEEIGNKLHLLLVGSS